MPTSSASTDQLDRRTTSSWMRLNLGVPLRALQERLDAVENECKLLASLKPRSTSNSSVASSPAGAVENLASAGAAASIFPCYPGDANCGGRNMRRGAASGHNEEE